MATANPPDLASLYLTDETAWLDAMAGLARSGRADQLDLAHLAEFLESMAGRERREVTSRLAVLLMHLLKWTHQPGHRSRSWRLTVELQRDELADLLESGTLRRHAFEDLGRAYERAILKASAETGLPESAFPAECPYTLDTAMTDPLETDPA